MKMFLVGFFIGFGVIALNIGTAHALFGLGRLKCPPQYKDLSSAPVDSDRYKGHCGLVVCTNEGRQGLATCEPIQINAYKQRIKYNCRPVPPTNQCVR